MRATSGGSNNLSVVYSNTHFRAFFVRVYVFIKDRKLRAQFKKTGSKMMACIYYDLLRHVNSINVNRTPSNEDKHYLSLKRYWGSE